MLARLGEGGMWQTCGIAFLRETWLFPIQLETFTCKLRVMRMNRLWLALPLLAAVELACGPAPGGVAVAVRDSAGVQIVQNHQSSWDAGGGWSVVAETPVLDLGAEDASQGYQFESVVDAVRLADGTIVVADAGRDELLYYDETGRHLATAGGQGEGPGRFIALGAMALLGDSVVAFDIQQSRVSVFGKRGQLLGGHRMEPTSDLRHPIHTYNLAGVWNHGLVLKPWAFMPGGGEIGVSWDSAANLVYSLDGMLLDTVAGFSGTEMEVTAQGISGRLFSAGTVLAVFQDRVFVWNGRSREIREYRAGTGLRRIVRFEAGGREVGEEDRELLIADHLRKAGFDDRADPRTAGFRRMMEAASLPHNMPVFDRILVDELGNLWAEGYQPPYERNERTWSVFDSTGRWLGDVATPFRFKLMHVGTASVIGVWLDSLDVQHVQLLLLEKGEQPGTGVLPPQ